MVKIFAINIAMFLACSFAVFSQENNADALQGVWYDMDNFVRLVFYNGSYETQIRDEPGERGGYTVSGNEITFKPALIYSVNFGEEASYGWLSREDVHTELGGRFDSWFKRDPQPFSINAGILTLTRPTGSRPEYHKVSGQNPADALQGEWYDVDNFIRITFESGSYKTQARDGFAKGGYTVSGNKITTTATHISSFPGFGNRWYSKEEALAEFGSITEFGSRVDGWFEPVTQTFYLDGDILIIAGETGEQRFVRVR